ncbi:MFS transporter [Aurantimonas sp. HBX-1]|uniref:MFS transporter n=1 Tax=Aurantimonas sp. HBX-1 TaxID=2906072 RepID=UPI001F23C2F8|nr:MFS transporter [Aurantimonas sp. HBX-1]UIJ72346.1 MFS transporter [Aurantimonas sp. HBX-1]
MNTPLNPPRPAARLAFPGPRFAVSIAFLINGFVLGSWAPQVPVLAARLGYSETALGLLILVFGLGALTAMPLIGMAISKGGSKRPTLATQLLLAASLPFLAFAPATVLAVPAAFFFGVTLGGMDVAMNANAIAVEKTRAKAIMSSCHGFWSLGGFAGAAAGGPLIAALGHEGHALFVGAVTLALLWPVSRFGLDDRTLPVTGAAKPAGGLAGIVEAARRDRTALLKALAIGIFTLFAFFPEGVAIDWSALFLRQDLGVDVAASGFAFAAFSAAMALFRFVGDPLRDRFGSVPTLVVSLFTASAGLCVIALSGELALVLIGFAVMGMGLANVVPVAFSAAGNLPGLKPGIGISIATTLGYSGALFAPSVVGFAAERFGFPTVFLTLAALLGVLLVMTPLVRNADRVRPGSERPEGRPGEVRP